MARIELVGNVDYDNAELERRVEKFEAGVPADRWAERELEGIRLRVEGIARFGGWWVRYGEPVWGADGVPARDGEAP